MARVSLNSGGVVMKALFALKNKLSSQKSLKSYAWYGQN